MGLITENNRQYYAGAQGFYDEAATAAGKSWTFTFNTNLEFYNWDPSEANYPLNNFKLYISTPAQAGQEYSEYILPYSVIANTITIQGSIEQFSNIVVQLKSANGGNYGNDDAYGTTVEENYGSYAYISLNDIVNNFLVAYVGADKLVPNVKRTDLLFHAKRGLQEFSYDTLRSVKSQELTVPPSLSLPLPQDYVNYIGVAWVDSLGVKHPIYPANNLTSNPSESPVQDGLGVEVQDGFNHNIEGGSIMEQRWASANDDLLSSNYTQANYSNGLDWWGYDWGNGSYYGLGQQYGSEPQLAQVNGWFTINDREGKISFSSGLNSSTIIFDYVTDGLASDADTRVPKMAEEAMYAHIIHAIVSTRSGYPEYLVQRFKQERSAKLRNAKIRLSNIKLSEIVQVMRGKSKQIKH
tara:strand:+ start:2540 stop:3769 length:1230 start_codon:yes stop_codon:yes gene_type:complete